jgi:hypothetical protein
MLNQTSRFLYDDSDPAAAHVCRRDDEFFARHPGQVWRVRPPVEGESPLAAGICGLNTGCRSYAIVIDHARAGDKRVKAERVVYPVMIRDSDKNEARWTVTREAARWARWFRKHSTKPTPSRGRCVVT